jgi:hypothetical protein
MNTDDKTYEIGGIYTLGGYHGTCDNCGSDVWHYDPFTALCITKLPDCDLFFTMEETFVCPYCNVRYHVFRNYPYKDIDVTEEMRELKHEHK